LILAGMTTINLTNYIWTTKNIKSICYNLGIDITICNFWNTSIDWASKDCKNPYCCGLWIYPYIVIICSMV